MTVWKNLHFRPPILKNRVGDGVFSQPVLFRRVLPEGRKEIPYSGYILIRDFDDSFYRVAGRGCVEHEEIDYMIEWTEVPE